MKKTTMRFKGRARAPRWAVSAMLAMLAAALHAPISYAGTNDVLATVNGVPIRSVDLDEAMIGRPQAARPKVLQGLVARELLRQAAEHEGLGESEPVRAAMRKAKIDTENRLYLAHHLSSEPITDAQVHERYDALVRDTGQYQYRVSRMTLADEPTARFALLLLDGGASFQQAASRVQSSDVETSWVSFRSPPAQGHTDGLPLGVAQSIAMLKPGEIAREPIRVGNGWVISRLDDRRDMTIPSYEQARDSIRKAMEAKRGDDTFSTLIDQLAKKSTIRSEEAGGGIAK